MNNFAILEYYDFSKVRFYTVQFLDTEISETDKFIRKFQNSIEYSVFFNDIIALINEIGDRGALEFYFNRRENDFQALPNRETARAYHQGEQLRLYCLRLSNSVVILFNGGVKDATTSQNSKCSTQFYEAVGFTKKILDALRDEFIEIKGKIVLDYKGSAHINL